MTTRQTRILTALCGLLGAVTLVGSFFINPAPPPGSTTAQVLAFGRQHEHGIIVGAWMQGIGSLLNVLFFLALVHLAGATHRLAGWLTLLASGAILSVSLLEVAGYLSAVQAGTSGDLTALMVSLNLIKAVQHVFLIAPAIFLPLGAVILGSRVLPRIFGYTALALGATLQVLGLVGLFNVLQPVIDVLLIMQEVWLVAAALALLVRREQAADAAPVAGSARATATAAGSSARAEGTHAR